MDNTEEVEVGSLDSGYLESGDCMSETDGTSSDGTYLETADEKLDFEDSRAWTARGTIPNEGELEQIDWETFYCTGELIKVGEHSRFGQIQNKYNKAASRR